VIMQNYNTPQWFLIYTKPHQEEIAKENLENQGFETFLPMIAFKKIKQPKLFSMKPMFPRYLFTKFNLEKDKWVRIKSTRGVSHVVAFGENFTEVPSSVISYLKSKVDNNDVLKLHSTSKILKKGDNLLIKQGVFEGKEATFLSMSGKERARVLLSLMNRIMITDIPEQNIESKAIVETFEL